MKRVNKRLFSILIATLLAANICVNASATTRARRTSLNLTFSGSTAICKVMVQDSNKEISTTMQLWRGNTLVATWSGSGTSYVYLSKTKAVTSGTTYTLKAFGTINGIPFTLAPVTKTC